MLKKGTLLKQAADGKLYRVIAVGHKEGLLYKVGSNELTLYCVDLQDLSVQISKGKWEEIETTPEIVDLEALSETERERFTRYKKMMDEISDTYGPGYRTLINSREKRELTAILEKYQVSRQVFWKLLKRYFERGCCDSALLDGRRNNRGGQDIKEYGNNPGPKPKNHQGGKILTDEDKKIIQKYTGQYLRRQYSTIKNAYCDMLKDEYTDTVSSFDEETGELGYETKLLPEKERPSFDQFYYHIRKNTTIKERRAAKETARKVRNNERAMRGTAKDHVRGPGQVVEIDAQEMDIAMVSKDSPDVPVGRPILYAAIDVYTEMILGVSVALDNNSVVGLTNCLLNFVEDKADLIRKYSGNDLLRDIKNAGRTIDEVWPSFIRPETLRVDNGSDFISHEIHRIAKELSISIQNVSPATGSLKGTVEGLFHAIKNDIDSQLENKGLITRDYGSKHHQQACLDIDDVRAIVLNEVVLHNMNQMKGYQKAPDMIRRKIKAIPADLWAYSKEKYEPHTFSSRDDLLWHVMHPETAVTVSRKGIRFCGMWYFNTKDQQLVDLQFEQGNKRTHFVARSDPRDMGHIYYLRDGKLQTASLDRFDNRYAGYFGMSRKEFDELKEMDKKIQAEGEQENLQRIVQTRKRNAEVIKAKSSQHKTDNSVKGMRDARKEEKALVSAENSIAEKFSLDPMPKDENVSNSAQDAGKPELTPAPESEREAEAEIFSPDDEDAMIKAFMNLKRQENL
jgi:hypothetical protein